MRIKIMLAREQGMHVARVTWLDPDGTVRAFSVAAPTRSGALRSVGDILERQGIE